jgi:hypothetical protein
VDRSDSKAQTSLGAASVVVSAAIRWVLMSAS